jgi:glycerophosphoryl diester phosphodiesterase
VQDDIGLSGVARIAQAIGVRRVGIRQNHLDAESLATLRDYGLGVGAWAVNDESAITRMLALGVDVFTTDIPTAALRLRG